MKRVNLTEEERIRRDALIVETHRAYGRAAPSPVIAALVAESSGLPVSEQVVRRVLLREGEGTCPAGRPRRGAVRFLLSELDAVKRRVEGRINRSDSDESTVEVVERESYRDQLQDLRTSLELLRRAAVRLVAAYAPEHPEEVAALVMELGIAAGCARQLDAVTEVESWGTPIRSSYVERMPACYAKEK